MSQMKEWPQLVGKKGEEAKTEIENEDSSLKVQLIPADCGVTADFRTDRVRIFVDADGNVAKPPRVG